MGDLAHASLIVGLWCRMLLKYMDIILFIHPSEVVMEDASGARRPGATGEGVLALPNVPGIYELVDFGEMVMLAYWHPALLIAVLVPCSRWLWYFREMSVIPTLIFGNVTHILRCSWYESPSLSL